MPGTTLSLRILPSFGIGFFAAAALLLAAAFLPPLAGSAPSKAAELAPNGVGAEIASAPTLPPPQVAAAPRPAAAPGAAAASPAEAPAPARQPVAPAAGRGPAERWLAEGVVFLREGQEWDAASLDNVDRALASLPARVRARLGNPALGALTIVVNSHGRTLSGLQPYGHAANFFSTNEGRNELVLFPNQRPLTVLHELGHAYNLRGQPAAGYALVLLDPEMASFMDAVGWRLLASGAEVRAARDHTQVALAYDGAIVWSRLSHNDPLEDFANAFALYYWSPEELRGLSPVRFDWFEANLGR